MSGASGNGAGTTDDRRREKGAWALRLLRPSPRLVRIPLSPSMWLNHTGTRIFGMRPPNGDILHTKRLVAFGKKRDRALPACIC